MKNMIPHPQFRIKAANHSESLEITKMFANMMEHMPYQTLLEAARKINSKPETKVERMAGAINFL